MLLYHPFELLFVDLLHDIVILQDERLNGKPVGQGITKIYPCFRHYGDFQSLRRMFNITNSFSLNFILLFHNLFPPLFLLFFKIHASDVILYAIEANY